MTRGGGDESWGLGKIATPRGANETSRGVRNHRTSGWTGGCREIPHELHGNPHAPEGNIHGGTGTALLDAVYQAPGTSDSAPTGYW